MKSVSTDELAAPLQTHQDEEPPLQGTDFESVRVTQEGRMSVKPTQQMRMRSSKQAPAKGLGIDEKKVGRTSNRPPNRNCWRCM